MDVIDANSLEKLVKRISSTYCTKFTLPRWKNFEGIGLHCRDKVRMNNLLWREWYLQCMARHGSSFCQFTCPLDDPIHRKPLAVVLEGKYWKRKLDAVTGEYNRRRVYWQERQRWKRRHSDESQMDSFDDKVSDKSSIVSTTTDNRDIESAISNSDDSLCVQTLEDAFIATCMQNSWMPSRRWEPEEQCISGSLETASEQDIYAVTLIEKFLRSGEMDWRSDYVADSQSSLQDAVDILATVVHSQKESTRLFTSAQDSESEMCQEQSQEHSNNVSSSSQEKSFSVPSPQLRKTQQDAKPTGSQLDAITTFSLNSTPRASDPRGVGSKSEFDILPLIVPSLSTTHPRKLTKATMLQHTAQYCKELREDNTHFDDQISLLKMQIELLKRQAVGVQNQIPTKETLHDNLRREMFDAWVCARSSHNCKFSVFALLLAPLYLAFMSSVSSTSEDELKRTILEWLHKSCSLASFRQFVLSSLTV